MKAKFLQKVHHKESKCFKRQNVFLFLIKTFQQIQYKYPNRTQRTSIIICFYYNDYQTIQVIPLS